jgi:hypothetical protein
MKFESLKENSVVYDCHSYKMGNTKLSTLGIWSIKVHTIDKEKRTCVASWNHNAPKTYYESQIRKWLPNKPTLVRTGCGSYRRMTREEKAAAKKAGVVTPIVH